MTDANEAPKLSLFVYGTLKSGLPAHDRFFGGVSDHETSVENAIVSGALYALPAGYPALEVPENDVLALGTSAPLSDARTQANIHSPVRSRPAPEVTVYGEVVRIAEPETLLPALDDFEGFVPGGESLYLRILIPAWTTSEVPLVVWAYVMNTPSGRRLPEGVWNP